MQYFPLVWTSSPPSSASGATLVTHFQTTDLLNLVSIFGDRVFIWPFNSPGYVSIDGLMYKVPAWLDYLITSGWSA